MAFYAQYPASTGTSASAVTTVQGEGTPGVPVGGILTVQGDPSGTPIPVTATNPSVGPTGSPVPAQAGYTGINSGGTLIGLTGSASGANVVVNAALPAGANTIGAVTQAAGPWTVIGTGTAGTAATGVVTVQGIAGMTPIIVDPSGGTGSVNVAQFGGNNVVTGTGTSGVGIPRVTVASDSSLASVTTVSAVTAISNALPAGTNILGRVGIDQTTPGTTNGVQINAALPAGANTIGAVTQASGPWTVTGTGTAGTAATGVVTIQGIASMTPVRVDPSGGTGAVNVTQFGGNNVVTGTGTSGVGIPRVTVSSDSSLTSVTTVSTVTAVTAITNALPSGTNIMGRVGIDQSTPGTTNAIQATSATTCVWQAEGNIAFGSITNAYQTVFTPSANTKILYMRNNTNAAISVSMDAGSTTNFILDSGDQVSTDFVSNGLRCTTSAIQIKYTVGAPTSGSFRVNGVS